MRVPITTPRPLACVQRAWRGFALSALILASACATTGRTGSLPAVEPPSCRAAAARAGAAVPVRWLADPADGDRATLDAWCRGVGPVEHLDAAPEVPETTRRVIAVVSWNVNVGAGDLGSLVSDLRAGRLSGGRVPDGFVLLLQEALRSGVAVPPAGPGQAGARRLVRSADPLDIVTFARQSQLALFYVPSMRNGSGRGYREDRGNAILATVPLSDLRALELPFARQRRVAAVATLALDRSGPPLAVASVHLDPFVGARRLWVFGASEARDRQARVVAGTLRSAGAFVVGGDLNTWRGDAEPAIAVMRRISDDAPRQPEPTYANGFVLDHIFFRLPADWQVRLSRASHTYGSDHFPLVGLIDVPEVLPSGCHPARRRTDRSGPC
jgi:endonuclease/exonuclease/phosphatase family metal-dependent hydrolase